MAVLLAPLLTVLLAPSIPDAMGFEVPGAWLTAPQALFDIGEAKLWSTRTMPLAELAGGATIVDEPVTQGEHALRWANHPRYPTIHCSAVPRDWSKMVEVQLDVHSTAATHEVVTVAVLADNPATPHRDWWLQDFRVVGTGEWSTVKLPRVNFQPLGKPLGWDNVGGVYLFTKVFGRQPPPVTELTLDNLRLVDDAPQRAAPAWPEVQTGALPTTTQLAPLPRHRYDDAPELAAAGPVTTPIQYQPYFQTERALFGYNPRYLPGTVSFAPDDTPYILAGAATIQWRRDDGRWQTMDLTEDYIARYAKDVLHFQALKLCDSAQTNETAIRFDADGDAYLMVFIEDPTGDWRTRTGLLLHSHDQMKTWTVYRLPYYMARFEKLVGHNPDALKRPPVILLSRYQSPNDIFIMLPEKQADGTLKLPDPIPIAKDAIVWIPHSGEANQALSHGDQVLLVYGQLKVLDGKTKEDGAPAFAVVYDRQTGKLSDPVLLGFGGRNAEDGHNWPAIAVDSQGILHVVINGHHDPLRYTHSLRPWDISAWSEPEQFGAGISYAGLVCDAQDTLYSVVRCSDPGYYFRLSLLRKKHGQPWEPARHLVIPYKPYYKVWMHKLVIAPDGRLFLSYHSQSPNICVFRDEYEAYIDIWPDREMLFQTGETPRLPVGTALSEPRKYEFYTPPASETCILVSNDHGDTWRLATSEEFHR